MVLPMWQEYIVPLLLPNAPMMIGISHSTSMLEEFSTACVLKLQILSKVAAL